MGKTEKECPTCYHNLPGPQDFLKPYDTELNYFMWMPGFEWKPKPEPQADEEETETENEEVEEVEEGEEDEEMEELINETVEQNEMKTKFDAKATDGQVNMSDACVLARQMGVAPSSADADKFKESHGEQLDYNSYEKFLAKSTHPEDNVEDLVSAFSHFDPSGNGYLTTKQMNNILMTWGEPLTAEEMSIVHKQFFAGGDNVDYRKFCEALLSRE